MARKRSKSYRSSTAHLETPLGEKPPVDVLYLDAYIRVSQVGGRSGESYQTKRQQRQQIEAYIAAKNADPNSPRIEIARWHEEEDESGGDYDRPMFQEALARVEANETGGIIVAKLDRFARSVVDANVAASRINDAGGQLVACAELIDTTSYMGRFVFNIFTAIAELELARFTEQWRNSRTDAVERGIHCCAIAPTGYEKDEDGRLVVSLIEGPAVTRAFVMRAEGATYAEIGEMFRAAGLPDNGWHDGTVRNLLQNRVYLGEARSGDIVKTGAHTALVDVETFQKAQSAKRGSTRGRNGQRLLGAGLLRCAGCGYALTGALVTRPGREPHVRYQCARKHAGGVCQAPVAVVGHVLEPFVVDAFLAQYGDLAVEGTGSDQPLHAARLAVQSASDNLDKFIDAANTGGLSQDRLARGIAQRQGLLDEAQARLEEIEIARGAAVDFARVDLSSFGDMAVEEQHELLAAGIDAIFVARGSGPIADRTTIYWHGTGPSDLPTQGRRATVTPHGRAS